MFRNDTVKMVLELIEKSGEPHEIFCNKKIQKILKFLTDEQIIEKIGMADMPLIICLLVLKYNLQPQIIPIENDLMIRVGNCNVANMSYLAVYIHFLRFENGKLFLEGTTSYPTVIGECLFGAKINGTSIKCELKKVGLDKKKGCLIYESRKLFMLDVYLESDTKISFYNEIVSTQVEYGRINSMRFAPIADCLPEQYYEKEGWMFYIEGKNLICKQISQEELIVKEKKFQQSIRKWFPDKGEWAIKLRNYYYNNRDKKKKPIWLFIDRLERADDNAKVFFKYVQKKPEIDSYFLISRESIDYEEIAKIGNVVAAYSEKHYKLALIADYIISSQCKGIVENPFWDAAEMFRDIYHQPKMIFLQHGVIKDDMSRTLNRFDTNFVGFVTSTQAEKQSILDYPYYYNEKEIWLTGLPRFDELENRKEKIILIMPSWRQSLMEQIWDADKGDMKWVLKPNVENSNFFMQYRLLLHNEKLHFLCEKYGYRAVFVAHPLMKHFVEQIVHQSWCKLGDENVSYGEYFAKGALLITDYSSVFFDFCRMDKPVIYYQFDKEEFFKEHTYKSGYFDYEVDGFGEVCIKEKELVKVIEGYLEDDCNMKEKYRQRVDKVWRAQKLACPQIYEKIMELEKNDYKQ